MQQQGHYVWVWFHNGLNGELPMACSYQYSYLCRKMNTVYLFIIFASFPVGFTQVFVSPNEIISVLGGSSSFLCTSSSIVNGDILRVQWMLNEQTLETLNLGHVTTVFTPINGGVGAMFFANISAGDNMTSIRCMADFTSGIQEVSSDASLLILQGPLSAVGSLNATALGATISLSWEAPFSLDISGVDPDISGYCVDVIHSASLATVHSECGITETEFNYPVPPDSNCNVYDFTVTPISVAGQGESATISYSGTEIRPMVLDVLRIPHSVMNDIVYLLSMTAPVCVIELNFVDLDTGETVTEDIDLSIGGNDTVVFASQLRDNRRYNGIIRARNVAGSATSHAIISTHGISNAVITETEIKGVAIIITYFAGSRVRGALLTCICITDYAKSVILPLNMVDSRNYVLPFSLSAESYGLFIYDIEQDGTLSSGVSYPAVRDQLVASGENQGADFQPSFSHLQNCHVENSDSEDLISVECIYPSVSMATGFQVVVQSNLGGKLYVNKTTDYHTSVTIEVEESGQYLVSIIPILEGTGITNSAVEYREIVMVKGATTVPDTSTSSNEIQVIVATGIVLILLLLSTAVLSVYFVVMKLLQRKKIFIDHHFTKNEQGNEVYKQWYYGCSEVTIVKSGTPSHDELTYSSKKYGIHELKQNSITSTYKT